MKQHKKQIQINQLNHKIRNQNLPAKYKWYLKIFKSINTKSDRVPELRVSGKWIHAPIINESCLESKSWVSPIKSHQVHYPHF